MFVLVQVNVALGGIQLFNGNTFDGCSVPFTPVFFLEMDFTLGNITCTFKIINSWTNEESTPRARKQELSGPRINTTRIRTDK